MEGLDDRPAQSPFFAYLALTTPHYPLQAPQDTIDKFKGWYADGYSAVKAARLVRQRELGIISTDFMHWPEPLEEDWSTLDTAEQEREARRMEVYAAMVKETDRAIGKLMDYLKARNLTDNTLVIFASDNGADASLRGAGADDRYNNGTANIGAADSYVTLGKPWAQVSSTPWRLVKSHPTEGGVRVPFIARLPGRIPRGEQSDELLLLRDLLPTFLAMLGSDFPRPTLTERKSTPPETMIGRSAALTLSGGVSAYGNSDTLIHTYVEKRLGGANVQSGDWKLVWWKRKQRYLSPMLFNIRQDPAETVDLAKQNEAKVRELLEQWTSYQRYAGPAISEAIPSP
jgi:arylsulfatase